MDSSYHSIERSSSARRVSPPEATSSSLNKSGYILIALGIIILVGSSVTAGCLYAQLGYVAFAIGGGGAVVSVICFVRGHYCRSAPKFNPVTGNPEFPSEPLEEPIEVPANFDQPQGLGNTSSSSIPPQGPAKTEPPKLPPLPKILETKVEDTSPLLPDIPKMLFLKNNERTKMLMLGSMFLKNAKPETLFEDYDFETELFNIPLAYWVKRDPKMVCADWYEKTMTDPLLAHKIRLVQERIDALEKTFDLKERLKRLDDPYDLRVGDLLPGWSNSRLKFALMMDDELAQLTVSSVEKDKELFASSKVAQRFPKIAQQQSDFVPPKLITKQTLEKVLLTDLKKFNASQINSAPDLFPSVALVLIDFNEFKKIDFDKFSDLQDVVDAVFAKTSTRYDEKQSQAEKRVQALSPETLNQLSPYLSDKLWGFLNPDLIKKLNFAKVFAKIPNEDRRKDIVRNGIFKNTDSYLDEPSKAETLMQAIEDPEAIYELAPYLTNKLWGFLSPTLIKKLDFAKVFAKIPEESARKDIVRSGIFESAHLPHYGKPSKAETLFKALKVEAIYELYPYLTEEILGFISADQVKKLDFGRIFSMIKTDYEKKEFVKLALEGRYGILVGGDSLEARLKSISKPQLNIIKPYLSASHAFIAQQLKLI